MKKATQQTDFLLTNAGVSLLGGNIWAKKAPLQAHPVWTQNVKLGIGARKNDIDVDRIFIVFKVLNRGSKKCKCLLGAHKIMNIKGVVFFLFSTH